MKSARGIYYDLKESEYFAFLTINNELITFYFSSLFNRKRFLNKMTSFTHDENLKLTINYNVNIDATKLLLLSLYKKIEKRGFRVLINNEEIDTNKELIII